MTIVVGVLFRLRTQVKQQLNKKMCYKIKYVNCFCLHLIIGHICILDIGLALACNGGSWGGIILICNWKDSLH